MTILCLILFWKNYSRASKEAARGVRSALAKLEQRMEDGKNHAPMSELAAKVKIYKKQIEEAEVITALNLAKFRKAQQELEEVEERARVLQLKICLWIDFGLWRRQNNTIVK